MTGRTRKMIRRNGIAGLLLCLAVSTLALAAAPQTSIDELQFHSRVPLGVEGFTLGKTKRKLYLMALAEDSGFEGMRQVKVDKHQVLLNAQGRQVNYFPVQVEFRVTATMWPEDLVGVNTTSLDLPADPNYFLLHLRFQLKIFRGLRARSVTPASVRLIGMPADVAYQERIYAMKFNIGRTPVDDRIVLEVLSPDGQRICKFHLDMN